MYMKKLFILKQQKKNLEEFIRKMFFNLALVKLKQCLFCGIFDKLIISRV